MTVHHFCVGGLAEEYRETAREADDIYVKKMLRDFEGKFKGSKPGEIYQTTQWRIYKRVWRQEAHRRGFS